MTALKIFFSMLLWSALQAQALDKSPASPGENSQFILHPAWERVATGLNFPEGPAWDGQSALYVSNCYGGWIARLAQGQVDTFLYASEHPFTFKKTNGLTVFKDGNIYACDFGIGAILKISPAGNSEIYSSGFNEQAFNRPNDLTFDSMGNLYFTDPLSYSQDDLDGRIFRISANGRKVALVAAGLAFPNGLGFSPDGQYLYVCESALQRIIFFKAQSDGALLFKDVFVKLPGGDPDGIVFDQAGNLYVAHFGGGSVYVVAPDGSIKQKLVAPGKKPTNVELGGPDLTILFLTEVETNALYQMKVPVPGLRRVSWPILKK